MCAANIKFHVCVMTNPGWCTLWKLKVYQVQQYYNSRGYVNSLRRVYTYRWYITRLFDHSSRSKTRQTSDEWVRQRCRHAHRLNRQFLSIMAGHERCSHGSPFVQRYLPVLLYCCTAGTLNIHIFMGAHLCLSLTRALHTRVVL